ncbi:hypothetical protein PICSAR252_01700 [Mycobacterium avium subsp. paratuberculosis]|nr:hypothetical protein PICSAR252_01700 [Mycobacterium avium subsp. paratuberculosis]
MLEPRPGTPGGDQAGHPPAVAAAAVADARIHADLADEHVDGGHQVGVQLLGPDLAHRGVDVAAGIAGQRQQRLAVPHVTGRAPGRFQPLPHRHHQVGAAHQRRAAPRPAHGLVGERGQITRRAAQRDQVGAGEAQRLVGAAQRPQFAADRVGVDAVVGHPGRHHARGDRIVVEHPPHRGRVAHHGHPSLADKAEQGWSRHAANSLCCKLVDRRWPLSAYGDNR